MNPQCQLLEVAPGRKLVFAELGAPAGKPVVYCHGFAASRLEGRLAEAAARRVGVRLIAIDRPGHGRSDFQPGRRLIDWPVDVTAVAEFLKLERFAVLGVSGGGPHALACGRLPDPRLAGVGIVCGLGPLKGTGLVADMHWPVRLSLQIVRRFPRGGEELFRLMGSALLGRFPSAVLKLLAASAPPRDREALRDSKCHRLLVASIREGLRRGGRGLARELRLYTEPWGFDPEEVQVPVLLWHGSDDATVPCSHGRHLAGRLSQCRAEFLQGEGHFSLPIRHAENILKTLADRV